jgi:hypothetical protein
MWDGTNHGRGVHPDEIEKWPGRGTDKERSGPNGREEGRGERGEVDAGATRRPGQGTGTGGAEKEKGGNGRAAWNGCDAASEVG